MIPRRRGGNGVCGSTAICPYIYIPPICSTVSENYYCNAKSTKSRATHSFTSGTSNSQTHSQTISVGLGAEISGTIKAITLGASASFSASWSQEISQAIHSKRTETFTADVAPYTMLTVIQKILKYGQYEIKSGSTTHLEDEIDWNKCSKGTML